MVDKKRTTFNVKGVGEINSVGEMARLSNQSVGKVLYKRGVGLSDEDIFDRKKSVKYGYLNGEYFYTFKNLLNKHKASYPKVRYLLSQGATLEEALGYEESDLVTKGSMKGTKITIRGVTYDRIVDAIEIHRDEVEVSHTAIRQRKYQGWSDEEALFTKKGKRIKKGERNGTNKRKGI